MPYTLGVDGGRLFLEWVAIALLIGGLVFILGPPKELYNDNKSHTEPVSTKKSDRLFAVTLVLTVLALCLCMVSYRTVRKLKRLEAGIENVKSTIYGSDAVSRGHFVWSGPVPLSPESAEYNEQTIREKDELILQMRQQLEALY
jgi:hypothetical protein